MVRGNPARVFRYTQSGRQVYRGSPGYTEALRKFRGRETGTGTIYIPDARLPQRYASLRMKAIQRARNERVRQELITHYRKLDKQQYGGVAPTLVTGSATETVSLELARQATLPSAPSPTQQDLRSRASGSLYAQLAADQRAGRRGPTIQEQRLREALGARTRVTQPGKLVEGSLDVDRYGKPIIPKTIDEIRVSLPPRGLEKFKQKVKDFPQQAVRDISDITRPIYAVDESAVRGDAFQKGSGAREVTFSVFEERRTPEEITYLEGLKEAEERLPFGIGAIAPIGFRRRAEEELISRRTQDRYQGESDTVKSSLKRSAERIAEIDKQLDVEEKKIEFLRAFGAIPPASPYKKLKDTPEMFLSRKGSEVQVRDAWGRVVRTERTIGADALKEKGIDTKKVKNLLARREREIEKLDDFNQQSDRLRAESIWTFPKETSQQKVRGVIGPVVQKYLVGPTLDFTKKTRAQASDTRLGIFLPTLRKTITPRQTTEFVTGGMESAALYARDRPLSLATFIGAGLLTKGIGPVLGARVSSVSSLAQKAPVTKWLAEPASKWLGRPASKKLFAGGVGDVLKGVTRKKALSTAATVSVEAGILGYEGRRIARTPGGARAKGRVAGEIGVQLGGFIGGGLLATYTDPKLARFFSTLGAKEIPYGQLTPSKTTRRGLVIAKKGTTGKQLAQKFEEGLAAGSVKGGQPRFSFVVSREPLPRRGALRAGTSRLPGGFTSPEVQPGLFGAGTKKQLFRLQPVSTEFFGKRVPRYLPSIQRVSGVGRFKEFPKKLLAGVRGDPTLATGIASPRVTKLGKYLFGSARNPKDALISPRFSVGLFGEEEALFIPGAGFKKLPGRFFTRVPGKGKVPVTLMELTGKRYVPEDVITRVRATAIIRDKYGRIMLVNTKDQPYLGRILPGGDVKPGETVKKALARELFEETGLRVKSSKKAFVFMGSPKRYGKGRGTFKYVQEKFIVYDVKTVGKPSPKAEVSQISYARANTLVPLEDTTQRIFRQLSTGVKQPQYPLLVPGEGYPKTAPSLVAAVDVPVLSPGYGIIGSSSSRAAPGVVDVAVISPAVVSGERTTRFLTEPLRGGSVIAPFRATVPVRGSLDFGLPVVRTSTEPTQPIRGTSRGFLGEGSSSVSLTPFIEPPRTTPEPGTPRRITPTPPTITTIEPIDVPFVEGPFSRRKKKKLVKKKKKVSYSSFLVITKVRKKPVLVSETPLAKGQALALGTRVTKRTERASFKLVPTKQKPRKISGLRSLTPRQVYAKGFRPPIRKGKIQPRGLEFIQRRRTRLGTRAEVKAVKSFIRSPGRKPKVQKGLNNFITSKNTRTQPSWIR